MKKITSLTQLVPGVWCILPIPDEVSEMGIFKCLSYNKGKKRWRWSGWLSDGDRNDCYTTAVNEERYIKSGNYYAISYKKAKALITLWSDT